MSSTYKLTETLILPDLIADMTLECSLQLQTHPPLQTTQRPACPPPLETTMTTMPPVPPPPPPPPTMSVFTLPINVPDSEKKLKKLQWTRIPLRPDKDDIWKAIHKAKDPVPVDYDAIENLFYCKDCTNQRSKKFGSGKKDLLDFHNAMNIKVFLKKFKSPDELVKVIREGDIDRLELKHYEEIYKILTEKEIADLLREQSLDKLNGLSIVDQFMVKLINIPDIVLWIKVVVLKGKLTGLNHIPRNLSIIRKACDMIMTDKTFVSFLRYVYHIGLFMNKGVDLGRAVGFKICSLKKLSDTKSMEKEKFTLLDFIVREFQKSKSSSLEFVDNFHFIMEEVKRCQLGEILVDCKQMVQKKEELVETVDFMVESSSPIKDKCEQFKQDALNQVSYVQKEKNKTEEVIQKTLVYFAEDKDVSNIDGIFETIRDLCKDIKSIQDKTAKQTGDSFKRGHLRSTMPVGRKKQNVIAPMDGRLSMILEKRRSIAH